MASLAVLQAQLVSSSRKSVSKTDALETVQSSVLKGRRESGEGRREFSLMLIADAMGEAGSLTASLPSLRSLVHDVFLSQAARQMLRGDPSRHSDREVVALAWFIRCRMSEHARQPSAQTPRVQCPGMAAVAQSVIWIEVRGHGIARF